MVSSKSEKTLKANWNDRNIDVFIKICVEELSKNFMVDYDESGSIGKRYRRQDEIGTPICITYDFDSENDGCVTVRDRDSMTQERVSIDKLTDYIQNKIEF